NYEVEWWCDRVVRNESVLKKRVPVCGNFFSVKKFCDYKFRWLQRRRKCSLVDCRPHRRLRI
ncbi:hypothetical protein NECAME_04436, partial [Necator americanus]